MAWHCLLERDDIPADVKAVIRQLLQVPSSAGSADEAWLLVQRDLALALLAAESLPEALAACLRAAIDLSAMDAGGVYLVEEAAGDLVLACHEGLSPEFVEAIGRVPADSLRGQRSHAGAPNYRTESELQESGAQDVLQEGLRSCAAVPVSYQGRLIAQFNVASRSLPDIPQETRRVLEMVGGLVGVAIHRFRAEQELRDSEERYRALVESAPDAIFAVDAEGTVLAVNPAAARLLGVGREDVVGRSLRDIFPPPEAERRIGIMRRIYETKEQAVATYQEPYPGLGLRWFNAILSPVFDAFGNVTCVLGIARDITEQVEAQQALRASEGQYRTLVEAAPDAIMTIDAEGTILSANAAMAKRLGCASGSPIGKRLHDFVPPERVERRMTWIRQVLDTGAPLMTRDRGSVPGYEDTWYEAIHAPVRDAEGNARHVLVVSRDVTEQIAAEEERRQLADRLQQAQRLESLGVLAGGIAHDFSNLLTGLLGNLSLAKRRLHDASPAQPYLQRVESAASQAADLAESMLAYSGRGLIEFTPLDLRELLTGTVELAATSLPEGIGLAAELPPELPAVLGEAAPLRGVLLNLIGNAAEALGEAGGAITVGATALEADRVRLAQTYVDDDLPEGPYVCLSVSDSGPGMSAEVLARVFDPFFSTKPNGRGLGLASALGVVRAHRGAMQVHSTPGEGSRFEVLLPVATGVGARPIAEPPAPQAHGSCAGLVLLAEDEALVRIVAADALQEAGFTVLQAADGHEALRLFHEHQAEVQAVLLDLAMPGLDGMRVVREIRRVRPEIPVVVASAYNGDGTVARLQDGGPARCLPKPYRPQQLVAAVREVLTP